MRRHGFDPVSFVFGVLFVGLGIMFLAGDGSFEPGVLRLVVPVVVIAIGLAVLGSAVTGRNGRVAPATETSAAVSTAPEVVGEESVAAAADDGDDPGDDVPGP